MVREGISSTGPSINSRSGKSTRSNLWKHLDVEGCGGILPKLDDGGGHHISAVVTDVW